VGRVKGEDERGTEIGGTWGGLRNLSKKKKTVTPKGKVENRGLGKLRALHSWGGGKKNLPEKRIALIN